MLEGYKTYLVCVAAILTAVVAYVNKTIGLNELISAIFAALGGITLRNAIAKK